MPALALATQNTPARTETQLRFEVWALQKDAKEHEFKLMDTFAGHNAVAKENGRQFAQRLAATGDYSTVTLETWNPGTNTFMSGEAVK